jgi:hypothetical protein
MRKLSAILLICLFVATAGCFGSRGESVADNRKKATVLIPAGTQHPLMSVAFDLSYDRSTDGIIPGYRFLTVGITNNSMRVLQLRPMVDRWFVLDRRGKKKRAIMNLRHHDPDVWTALPQRLKKLIEYPLIVGVGTTRAIDLLFPESVELADFQQVHFESVGLGKIIQVYARESTQ